MTDIKNLLTIHASFIEDKWDELTFKLTRKLGLNKPVQIVPYRTYGTQSRIYVKGRVLQNKNIMAATDKDTVWNNLLNMYKRFETDEVPNTRIKIELGSQTHEVLTDKEGYFVFDLNPDEPILNEKLWHSVKLMLEDAPIPFQKGLTAFAEVMIPPVDAEYGVISDIDDTIIQTGVTNLLAMSRTTFLHNFRTRLPFAGVAAFYKSLQLGRNGKRNNPFFYVSSSPWNLYDLLIDFLDHNQIPEGPLLLRDFGLEPKEKKGHLEHKLSEIKKILEAYPLLNFVLIGDSGQEDPAIYQTVAQQFPGRILAIYIRDVLLPERKKIAVKISGLLAAEKLDMIIVENSVEAAAHAAEKGLILPQALEPIIEEKKEDKGEKPGKEDL